MRASLRDLALSRLGHTDLVVSSSNYFRAALASDLHAHEIASVAPVLAVQGSVMHEDSRRSASRVQIFGIDDAFLRFHERADAAPGGREAWISPGLADELGAAVGDGIVLRLAKPTDIPLSHLQGRREDASQRVRVSVARVADRAALGEFSLVPTQGPALSVFVPLTRLQQDLGIAGSANALLVRMAAPLQDPIRPVRGALASAVELDDLGLRVRRPASGEVVILESRTGLLPPAVWEPAAARAADRGARPVGVLTYLANTIRARDRELPYSLITAIDLAPSDAHNVPPDRPVSDLPPMWLNEWAAADLGVAPGDQLEIEYYLWSDQDGLLTRNAFFIFAGTVPMSGLGGDASLTPEYPGITDAADVMSWDPPFPIELRRIRKQDEDYWDRWGAAPKAFIPLPVGQQLWPSPFGTLSSLRTDTIDDWPTADNIDAVFTVRNARAEALAAADGTTDFGEYFIYFSFFLVVSGLLLAGMFFALSVEQRGREIGLLLAVGYRETDVRRLLRHEGVVLTAVGSLFGMAGAVAYAALIMYGLRTWWVGAVNTTALELHVDSWWLLAGALGAFASAYVALTLAMRRLSRQTTRALLVGGTGASIVHPADLGVSVGRGLHVTVLPLPRWTLAWLATGIAVALVAAAAAGVLPATAAFFMAGALLMMAGCAAFASWLRRPGATTSRTPSIAQFGAGYARWRPTRSVLSAALIAFACFVIVAVTAFRRDAVGWSLEPESGTGGFVLMAESIAPLMHNPNTADGRAELSLTGYDELDGARITRLRLRPGDEASCLTLYQPTNPRIVAPEASFLDDSRFTFARSLAENDQERANPWLLLHRRFDDGAVPAVVDQTSLTYVFHLSVGDDFVFTPEGRDPVRLRIVGTLADSVLQSELIIGEHDFVRLFPMHEGYRIWMIEASPARATEITTVLEDRLSDFGVDVTDTRARLASYHQVENTYLSTFQALGALGLLLGTLGLAAVLARNVLERRRELGVLGAIGFTRAHMRTLVTSESLVIVGTGVAIGTIAALVAIAPALIERTSSLPIASLALLIGAVILTGLLASLAAVRMATTMNVVNAIKNE